MTTKMNTAKNQQFVVNINKKDHWPPLFTSRVIIPSCEFLRDIKDNKKSLTWKFETSQFIEQRIHEWVTTRCGGTCFVGDDGSTLVSQKNAVHHFIRIISRKYKTFLKIHNRDHHLMDRRKVFHGHHFPDMELDIHGKRTFVKGVPLLVPNVWVGQNKPTEMSDRDFYHTKVSSVHINKFAKGRNHYCEGALYDVNCLSEDVFLIKSQEGDEMRNIDLVFDLLMDDKSRKTHLKVRMCEKADLSKVTKAFYPATDLLSTKVHSNCRRNKQPTLSSNSFMFTFGHDGKASCLKSGARISFKRDDLKSKSTIKTLGNLLGFTFRKYFPMEMKELMRIEDKFEGEHHVGKFAHTMEISHNLENASHYDAGDAGYGFSIWLQKEPHLPSRHWYFILPNATIKGSRGVAIQLSHGTMISWNGAELKHCTMMPSPALSDSYFGCFMGPKQKFCNDRLNPDVPLLSRKRLENMTEINSLLT
jgi:hypothetical protein